MVKIYTAKKHTRYKKCTVVQVYISANVGIQLTTLDVYVKSKSDVTYIFIYKGNAVI
jgi:hypothetical protein